MYNQDKNRVERAISEIRRGIPVIIYDEDNYLLFTAAELLEKSLFDQFRLVSNKVYITLTSSKVKYISKGQESNSQRLLINNFDEINNIINFFQEDNIKELKSSKSIDESAASLLKLSELLPYALVVDMHFKDRCDMQLWCQKNDVITLDALLIDKFQYDQNIYEVCRTPLFLKQTQKANIISYRTCSGQKEHYAIIIGDIKNTSEPLVRIHSSCYTGDLLDSLSCDCRSQLHQAIQAITDAGSGVILYLMQDGRGIGLTNKLRAYKIQEEYGLDTVDANRTLGFKDDERNFTVAAKILEKLEINKLQLLTNNDKKLSELKNCGIKVTKCIPLIVEYNERNYSYMKTKYEKLGHKLMFF